MSSKIIARLEIEGPTLAPASTTTTSSSSSYKQPKSDKLANTAPKQAMA